LGSEKATNMSNKRRRLDLDATGLQGGGLYGGLSVEIEDDDDVALVDPAESKPTRQSEDDDVKQEDRSKVIFLDIDGVLKPEGETQRVMVDGELTPILPRIEDSNFNKISLLALRMIVQKTGARLVLSSEWRRTELLRNAIGLSFRQSGIPQVISCTSVKEKLKPELLKAHQTIAFAERRAREIGDWLKAHPEVKTWIVIDDVDISWADGCRNKKIPLMRSHIVRTDAKRCLDKQGAQKAVRLLNNPPAQNPEEDAAYALKAARKLEKAYPCIRSGIGQAEPSIQLSAPKPIPRRQGF